ncbi:MAG: hypothetical protein Q7S45_02725 [Candidatus Curtissbacteria bacterium]|nr:hypothetical protein [Candidatus Curtissbacteria bacterium]
MERFRLVGEDGWPGEIKRTSDEIKRSLFNGTIRTGSLAAGAVSLSVLEAPPLISWGMVAAGVVTALYMEVKLKYLEDLREDLIEINRETRLPMGVRAHR